MGSKSKLGSLTDSTADMDSITTTAMVNADEQEDEQESDVGDSPLYFQLSDD
jgi:hypothetical protein